MIPILFEPTAASFDTFGVGVLTEAIGPHVREELNGAYTLELDYPVGGEWFGRIALRSIILAKPNLNHRPQPFRVKNISRPINGVVHVYAEHLVSDLSGIPILPFTASSPVYALSRMTNDTVVPNPFTLRSSMSTHPEAALRVETPCSVRSLMGADDNAVLATWGGEWRYDVYLCELLDRRGDDTGIVIRYGVDLEDVTQEENGEAVYTGVLPFWADGDKVVTGSVIQVQGYDYVRIQPLDVSELFEDKPTAAQVDEAGQNYVVKHGVGAPEISLQLRFAQLPELEALRGSVELGDTITVEHPRLGVQTQARIVAADFDVLRERWISVEVGTPLPTIADTIAEVKETVDKQPTASFYMAMIARATADILGAEGGTVRFLDTNDDGEPDTLYIADDPDPARAEHIWRFNYLGWGYSSNGYDGPFDLAATVNNGLVANFITAGVMSADRIQGGTLILGGLNNTNGEISVLDSSGNEVGHWNNTGLAAIGALVLKYLIGTVTGTSEMGPGTFSTIDAQTEYGPCLVIDRSDSTAPAEARTIKIGVGAQSRSSVFLSDGPLEIQADNGINTAGHGYLDLYLRGSEVGVAFVRSFGTAWGVTYGPKVVFEDVASSSRRLDLVSEHISTIDISPRAQGDYSIHIGKWNQLSETSFFVNLDGYVNISNDLRVSGDFRVIGTKSRIVATPDYGERLLYAYETPTPLFGDVGEGVIGEDGTAYIWLDPVFAETIAAGQYQVFLQAYGAGELYVRERRPGCFVAAGTPGLAFGWEVKARQAGFDQRRLDRPAQEPERSDVDYAAQAADYIAEIKNERMKIE